MHDIRELAQNLVIRGRVKWHVTCHGCQMDHDQTSRTVPFCCGACGSHSIKVNERPEGGE